VRICMYGGITPTPKEDQVALPPKENYLLARASRGKPYLFTGMSKKKVLKKKTRGKCCLTRGRGKAPPRKWGMSINEEKKDTSLPATGPLRDIPSKEHPFFFRSERTHVKSCVKQGVGSYREKKAARRVFSREKTKKGNTNYRRRCCTIGDISPFWVW